MPPPLELQYQGDESGHAIIHMEIQSLIHNRNQLDFVLRNICIYMLSFNINSQSFTEFRLIWALGGCNIGQKGWEAD